MKTLIKNARYIVSCDDKDTVYQNSNILIEDNIIKAIGSENFEADEIIDATDMVVYPGLINTHHHLYQTFSRNLPAVQNMELFPWLTYLYEIWKNINEEVIYCSSITGMGELVKHGCTTCFDHHYVFPKGVNGIIDAQFAAADDLGIRMHVSRGSMSLSKKDGGLPPDSVVQNVDEILKDSQDIIQKYHDVSEYSMKQVVLAPCSPFSVTSELMKESAALARKLGVRLHTHLAETKDEENYLKERYNMRTIEYMQSVDWLGDDVWFAHGIHFNDEELKILKDTKTGVAHCPISNMKLSSGIAQIPRMLELGVKVGLAVDGSASNDGSNLLEELRVCYLLHRLNSSSKAPTGYDVLKLATRGSASLLGRTDIGSLEEQKAADMFMISLNRVELVGAQFDPKNMLGTVGVKNAVDYTIINGKVVAQKGELKNIDEQAFIQRANKAVTKYISNP